MTVFFNLVFFFLRVDEILQVVSSKISDFANWQSAVSDEIPWEDFALIAVYKFQFGSIYLLLEILYIFEISMDSI